MDIDRARQKNLCFKCMRPGHMANQCPERGIRNIEELEQETINAIVRYHIDAQEEDELYAEEHLIGPAYPSSTEQTNDDTTPPGPFLNNPYVSSPVPSSSRIPTVGEPIIIYPKEESTESDF